MFNFMGWNYLISYEVMTFRCIILVRPTCLSKPTLRKYRRVYVVKKEQMMVDDGDKDIKN